MSNNRNWTEAAIMLFLAFVLLSMVSGCTTDPKTIAQGAEGSVDYCVDLGVIEPICVNATRKLGESEE